MMDGQLVLADNRKIHLLTIYRPPKTNKHGFVDSLHDLLLKIPVTHEILLIGDTNIDLLLRKTSSGSATSNYINNMSELGLECAVRDVTREEVYGDRVTRSCIDHVWVRTQGMTTAYVLTCKLSDHYVIGVCVDNKLVSKYDSDVLQSNRTIFI